MHEAGRLIQSQAATELKQNIDSDGRTRGSLFDRVPKGHYSPGSIHRLELQADGFDRRLWKTKTVEAMPTPIRARAKLDGSGAALPVMKPISVRCSKPMSELAVPNPAFAAVIRLL